MLILTIIWTDYNIPNSISSHSNAKTFYWFRKERIDQAEYIHEKNHRKLNHCGIIYFKCSLYRISANGFYGVKWNKLKHNYKCHLFQRT